MTKLSQPSQYQPSYFEKKAKAAGLEPKAYVDGMVEKFRELWKAMDISNNDFIRTTDERHIECVQNAFTHMLKNDDVYLSKYEDEVKKFFMFEIFYS